MDPLVGFTSKRKQSRGPPRIQVFPARTAKEGPAHLPHEVGGAWPVREVTGPAGLSGGVSADHPIVGCIRGITGVNTPENKYNYSSSHEHGR